LCVGASAGVIVVSDRPDPDSETGSF